ncbi:hypothetical protein [Turicimonas muris]|uniref:hypothetical protein n=1 Tax=Turicimonas muris TaxID=1796652 RepID=UPI0024954256|nr:hypothetical protein [Turicimonas muris]
MNVVWPLQVFLEIFFNDRVVHVGYLEPVADAAPYRIKIVILGRGGLYNVRRLRLLGMTDGGRHKGQRKKG